MKTELIDLEQLIWKTEFTYNKVWQNRCNNCPAPCCNFSMIGYRYDNDITTNVEEFNNLKHIFNDDFVIMRSWDENGVKTSWKPQLAQEESDNLMICPLNIYGKCMIYEDRPSICKAWKCAMKSNYKVKLE